jgi:hypothetical protein
VELSEKETELASTYAPKFWEAGNLVVTLVFGLTFAVYVSLLQHEYMRYLASKWLVILIPLAIISNVLLAFLLWRLFTHENRVTKLIGTNPILLDAIRSAYEIRLGLVAFNFFMYLAVLIFVRVNVDPAKPPEPPKSVTFAIPASALPSE